MKTREDKTECSSKEICCFPTKKRYLIAILCFLGIFNMSIARTNISVALVAMVSNITRSRNKTVWEEPAEFNWSSEIQGIILSSYFYGYCAANIPGGLLAHRFGGRNVLGFGLLVGAIITLLVPLASRAHVALLVTSQVALGISAGVVFPAMYTILSKWAPPLERATLVGIATTGIVIGAVLAFLLAGFLAEWLSWPSIFYFNGAIIVAWFCLWFGFVRDTPSDDPRISEEELLYIETSLENDKPVKGASDSVPWKALLTSCPVWAVIMVHFSYTWGYCTFITELPMFIRQQLKFDISTAGYLSSLPYIAMAITVPISGRMADWLLQKQILSTTKVRKLFISFSFVFQAVFLIIVSYSTDRIVAVLCLTLAVGGSGFIYGGLFANFLDISPTHAGVLFGLSNTIATVPGVVSPTLTGVIVQNPKSADEWGIVFNIAAIIPVFGAIFFCIFGSGDKQQWDGDYRRIEMGGTDEEELS